MIESIKIDGVEFSVTSNGKEKSLRQTYYNNVNDFPGGEKELNRLIKNGNLIEEKNHD